MGLMKKLTSALVASSLVLSVATTAMAAYTPSTGQEAGMRMMELKILKGRPGDDKLAVNEEITRAELVTVIVRAFGKEADAALLKGAPAFPDTSMHWASGEIAMAKALVEKVGGDAIGMPDGSFAPDAKLTPAQAVAFLMKFLGVKRDDTKSWPNDYLDKAVEIGLITAEDKNTVAPMLNDNATRGLVFYLFDNAFYSYELPNGKTFYTTYADTTAPTLTASVNETTTLDSKVTVSGTAGADAIEVYVGSAKVTTDANGAFTADVDLPELKDYDILVTARDVAGNVAEKALKVTRTVGTAATIEAAAITVAAGATVDVAPVVKDAKGNVVAGVAVTGESAVGTYADGKFTAATKAGTGTLKLVAGDITANVNVTITAGALAKVEASKANVKVAEKTTLKATDEYGNELTGATFTVDSADAVIAGNTFVATEAATYTVTATIGDKTATAAIGVYDTEVAKLVISGPEQVVGNSAWIDEDSVLEGTSYEITVTAVDENGNVVANYEENIELVAEAGFVFDKDDLYQTTLSVAAEAGVATFKVFALDTAVGQAIKWNQATTDTNGDDADGVIGDESDEYKSFTIEVVEQVATGLKFGDVSSKFIQANESDDEATVKVYVVDQNGKQYLDSVGYEIALSVSGAAKILDDEGDAVTSDTIVYSGDKKEVTFVSIKGVTGDATLTATTEGLGSTTAKVTAAIAQAPKAITVEADMTSAVANDKDDVTYSGRVVDANGVPVKIEGGFSLKGEISTDDDVFTTDGITLTQDEDNGVSTFELDTEDDGTFEFTLSAAKFTGDLKLTMKDDDARYTLSSANVTVNFVADEAEDIRLVRFFDAAKDNVVKVASTDPKVTVQAQVYDAAGNKSKQAGVKVVFTADSDDVKLNGKVEEVTAVTDANGIATVEVVAPGYVGDTYTITITADDDDNFDVIADKDEFKLQVVDKIAKTMSVTVTNAAGNTVTRPKAGETLYFEVEVTDVNGREVANDRIMFYPADDEKWVFDGETIDSADGVFVGTTDGDGLVAFEVYVKKAGNSIAYKVEDTTPSTALVKSGALKVIAGTPAGLMVNEGEEDALKVTEGKASGPITLKLVDQYNNPVAADQNYTVTFAGDELGVRTAVNAANASSLTIKAGSTGVTFYLWSDLEASDDAYSVTFTTTVDGDDVSATLEVEIED